MGQWVMVVLTYDPCTHPDLLTHLTHDPLTHCSSVMNSYNTEFSFHRQVNFLYFVSNLLAHLHCYTLSKLRRVDDLQRVSLVVQSLIVKG